MDTAAASNSSRLPVDRPRNLGSVPDGRGGEISVPHRFQTGTGTLLAGAERPGGEPEHSPQFNADVMPLLPLHGVVLSQV
jgi:hypothetical protein